VNVHINSTCATLQRWLLLRHACCASVLSLSLSLSLSPAVSDLHADDGVDEEEHGDEEADVGQRLEGLDEGPQQDADGVALPQ